MKKIKVDQQVGLKKLDQWADLLLDTGKRNNLINFKDTRMSTVEVLLPSAEVFFEKVNGIARFEVFDPKIAEEDEELGEAAVKYTQSELGEDTQSLSKRTLFLNQYVPKVKQNSQVLLYNIQGHPLTAIKNISKKAKEFMEETGVNVAYAAFGFVCWKESENSGYIYRAPLLLVPIQLEHGSAIDPYFICSTEDDVVVNPTFSYKLEAEYGVQLPDYDDEGLEAYLQKVESLVARLNCTVSAECKIGIFSFLKINMYRDLKDNAEAILANPNIRKLLGVPLDSKSLGVGSDSNIAVSNPLIELHSVVDADSSQIEAIEMAKSGKSFVLQGPPGTGKSQTITNIIAECLSDGKRVLFVSEKLAALSVVHEKLKQSGLSEFCLELHSHKSNKKDVIADICHTLREEKSIVSAKADSEIAIKEKAQRQLDAYAEELHRPRSVIEKSLYQLYEAYAALRSTPDVEWTVPRLDEKGDLYLTETTSLLEQYVDYIPSIGYDYRKNPWYGYINQDLSYQTKNTVKNNITAFIQFLQFVIPLSREISEKYGVSCTTIDEMRVWKKFFRLAADSEIITPALLNKENLEKVQSILGDLSALSAEILASRSELEIELDDLDRLNGEESNKKLVRQFSGVFSRMFNSEYKKIITDLRLCRKNGKKPSYNEAIAMTERLSNYQSKSREFCDVEAPIKAFLGSAYKGVETDWNDVSNQVNALEEIFSSEHSFGPLAEYSDFASERTAFSDYAARLDDGFEICGNELFEEIVGCFDPAIFNVCATSCYLLSDRFSECLNTIEQLDHWCHFRSLLSKLGDKQIVPYLDSVIDQNMESRFMIDAFKKLFYYQWIHSILSATPVLAEFNRISQDKAILTFSEKDKEQFSINKAKIRGTLSGKRPSLDMIAPGSALSVVLREGEKKRKQKSIRALLGEAGELIQRVKPCFLMSPLSVSTFLVSGSVHFDVVIFDEASQIFPQDAIGAIYRAAQLIVVGDSKQMPPSNFFNSTIEAVDNDEESGDVTDFESILDLCSTSMRQLRLRWHYRSRYEELIAFSNKNFYDNDLITFPSAKTDAPGVGVDYYHVKGVFDRKSHSNREEAEFVVDLIYQNIERYPERSLGVVAFSVAQQDLIDKLLMKRRQNTPEKEFFFKSDAKEPFFIKNLETVQGDERDTIIFSIAYGIDSQGRLLHNFGPLNRVGGERRLNVAVTRAKCNVQLVSSMRYTDIDLKRTSSEGVKLLREYLDFAENGNIALERSVTVNSFEHFDSDFEIEVYDFLRAKGFSVDTQVGCSGFKIDLGLKNPNSSDYVLAIECDGATYHSSRNARDRDRLRQEILERMGWKFYRIWSTDWFRNKSVEQSRLLEVAAAAINRPAQIAAKPDKTPSPETFEKFEEVTQEKNFAFAPYKEADIPALLERYWPDDFGGFVKDVLKVEAPLSEELFLRRIVYLFDREKVTKVVVQQFEEKMRGYERYGIVRRNGFLYLKDNCEIEFRGPGDIERDFKHIAPEELAAGMMQILRHNVTVEKSGLYRSLAEQCGINRMGRAITEALDAALPYLKDFVEISGDQLSLR